jgi:hypothetical protein
MNRKNNQESLFQQLAESQVPSPRVRNKVMASITIGSVIFQLLDLFIGKTIASLASMLRLNKNSNMNRKK